MNKFNLRPILKYLGLTLLAVAVVFIVWQLLKPIPTDLDWKDTLKVLASAQFKGNLVTVRNIRNFQYDASGIPTVENYYDKTYDLNKIRKVWYVSDPFNPGSPFAHTFLSFEFTDGSYLAITIEARLGKGQSYGLFNGVLHTFPIMYIAADERDVVYIRTNIFKDGVYVYPLKATPAQGKLLLTDMLTRMNELAVHPEWYNGVYSNCTSNIADHVNRIWPGLLPRFDWQTVFTGFADKLALDKGLFDTTLPLDQARTKFSVSGVAQKVGYVKNFSDLIRQAGRSTGAGTVRM